MSSLVDRLARTLLYEGYVLYPYRPSVKNSHRWTFGGIYPKAWSDAQTGNDSHFMQTQCLLQGNDQSGVRITIRFLHLIDRRVGRLLRPLDEMPTRGEPDVSDVPSMQVGDHLYQAWQEAEEREVDLGELSLQTLQSKEHCTDFQFPARKSLEPLRGDRTIRGLLIRRQETLSGRIEVSAQRLAPSESSQELFRLTVRITNTSDYPNSADRDAALMRSLVSTHTILHADSAQFVSLTDAPRSWQAEVEACKNIGNWPVLVGNAGQRDTILSSPIILSDYPQLAPESPGDLFDSTEIDEILTLRILTLTDEEKRSAAATDPRVGDLLERTQNLAREQLMNLHGTIRGLQPVDDSTQEQAHGNV